MANDDPADYLLRTQTVWALETFRTLAHSFKDLHAGAVASGRLAHDMHLVGSMRSPQQEWEAIQASGLFGFLSQALGAARILVSEGHPCLPGPIVEEVGAILGEANEIEPDPEDEAHPQTTFMGALADSHVLVNAIPWWLEGKPLGPVPGSHTQLPMRGSQFLAVVYDRAVAPLEILDHDDPVLQVLYDVEEDGLEPGETPFLLRGFSLQRFNREIPGRLCLIGESAPEGAGGRIFFVSPLHAPGSAFEARITRICAELDFRDIDASFLSVTGSQVLRVNEAESGLGGLTLN